MGKKKPLLSYFNGSEKDHEQVRKTLLKRHPEFRAWTLAQRRAFTSRCLKALRNQRWEKRNRLKVKLVARQEESDESRDMSSQPLANQSVSAKADPRLAYVKGSERGYKEVQKSLLKNHPEFKTWASGKQSSFAHNCKEALEKKRVRDKELSRLEHLVQRDAERKAYRAAMANLDAQLAYLSGSETRAVQVKDSLLRNHPEFGDWSLANRKKLVNKLTEALKTKRKQPKNAKLQGEERALLLEYFPVPASSDNEPYAECFDGTERSYRDVKKKLGKTYPEFKSDLEAERAHQIALKCWEHLDKHRKKENPGKKARVSSSCT